MRRSSDMDSGIVRISRYPFAAAAKARPMPVFPEVGSTSTVRPGVIDPSRSRASIMATPIRSFTELAGLKYSSLAATTAPGAESFAIRLRRTRGVFPMSFVMSDAIRMAASLVPGFPAQISQSRASRSARTRRTSSPTVRR